MTHPLAVAHVALSAVIVLWSIWMSGRVAQIRRLPRFFSGITALGGLFLAPALLVAFASSNIIYGRSLSSVAWLWPAVAILFAVQATYATARRMVTPVFGAPIAAYDIFLAVSATTRYAIALGLTPPDWALTVLAAQQSALVAAVSPLALVSPYFLLMPMPAPAAPAIWRIGVPLRILVAGVAGAWAGLIASELPRGALAVRSYAAYATDPLRERPEGDFAIGVKLFPDLAGSPSPVALRADLALADTLGVNAVAVVIHPSGVSTLTLDSLAHSFDRMRSDTTRLVVTLGNPAPTLGLGAPVPLDTAARFRALRRIARRLRPDYLLPVDEPYGAAARAFGRLPVEQWQQYLARAAEVVRAESPRTRVGVSIAAFDARDSTLYAWAASPASTLQVVGFSLMPSRTGARGLSAHTRAADRWMRATRSTKEHWVFSAAGLPLVHGEMNQEHALWGALAWATSHDAIKGFLVAEAGDYGTALGLRAPDRRLRRASAAVARARRTLEETARQ